MSETIEDVSGDEEVLELETVEDEKEIVEIYLEDLEVLAETIAEYEADEDIEEKIEKTLFNARNIYLNGIVDEGMAQQIIPLIHHYNLDAEKTGDNESIKIYINSPGGEMSHGNAIIQAIENSKLKVETIGQGTIASMGFVLFISGDVRKLSRLTEVMYHNLSAGFQGTYSEIKSQSGYYDRLQRNVDDYIVERTEIPLKKLQSYRKKNQDWFLTFDECRKYKIFDVEI